MAEAQSGESLLRLFWFVAIFEITNMACFLAHYYSRGVPRRLNQICERFHPGGDVFHGGRSSRFSNDF